MSDRRCDARSVIYDIVADRVQKHCKEDAVQIPRACLYWAHFATRVLEAQGERAILQAGKALWPRIRARDINSYPDDEPTHFGYDWEPHGMASRLAMAVGAPPEIHVWAAIPDKNEILDFASGFFPANCKEFLKRDWPGDMPPQWLWARADEIPDGVIYHPNLEATLYAVALIKTMDDGVGGLLSHRAPVVADRRAIVDERMLGIVRHAVA